MTKFSLFTLTFAIVFSANSQLKDLRKKLRDKAQDVIKETIVEETEKKRDSYDTSSFNFAIAFLDKSESYTDVQKGERLIKAADFVMSKEEEKSDLDKARDMYEAGNLSYQNRKYVVGEFYLRAAKVSFEELNEFDNPVYLKAIGTLGLLFSDMGRYALAEEYNRMAIDGWESTMGKESSGYAAEYNNMGVLNLNTANYNQAESILKETLELVSKTEGSGSVPYAIALNNLGILYQYMGRSNEALEQIEKCLEIGDKKLRDRSSTFLQLLTNKALILQENGNYDEAEITYKKAIDLQISRLKINKTSDPDYAHMLNNLASLYAVTGREEEAEKLLRESLNIYKTKFGGNHVNTANAQVDLGNLLRSAGKLEESFGLLTKAYSSQGESLGENHPKTIKTLEGLAIVNWLKGDVETSKTQFDEVMSNTMTFIDEFFPPMSEAEKTKYWEKLKPRFDVFYSFAFSQEGDKGLLEKTLEYRFSTKGLLLSTTTKIKNDILNSGNSELISLYKTWQDQKNLLATYYSMSKEDLKDQKVNIDSLETAANDTERRLSLSSKSFERSIAMETVSLSTLQSSLDDNEVIVEIVQYPHFDKRFTGENRYAAILVKKTDSPQVVILENGNHLESRYYAYYNNVIREKLKDEYTYDQYWKKISESLGGGNVIYFSPDGVYNQINIGTIPTPDNSYVANKLSINYIGNPKDIIQEKKVSKTRDAVLIGFPNYGDSDIPPLPGTETEVTLAAATLGNTYEVTVKMEDQASESAIKSISPPKILHIATHGFFLEDLNRQGSVFGVEIEYARNNPLLRSGLMLAGASKASTESSFEGNDNGILTAYEAMNLDLNDTDLVVLSACETGKGDIKSGEGVYGLQRAFQVAGARNLIMSLWKVDDIATQQLMNNFYNNWTQLPNDPGKSFELAQRQLMEEYKDPYYWGAFVFIGK